MQAKGLILLRVLLNRFHKKASAANLRCLPNAEEAKTILQLQVVSDNPVLALIQPEEIITKMHYSWLLPALKVLPKSMQLSALAALPKSHSGKLSSMLGYNETAPETTLAPPIKTFFIHKLYATIQKSNPLPLEYLPTSSLKDLVSLNKLQLTQILDLLGIYDLTEEVRHIIDKDRLKKVYNCLTLQQRQFLRICLHQKEKISASSLKLDSWNGDCKEFQRLIHNRGIVRLGRALSGQHPDFIWYVTHILDSGRGSLLLSYCQKEIEPQITPILIQQVINLMNYLSTKSKS